MRNLVLIGLKNAGKTSTSIQLAKEMSLNVLDTDALLVAKYNKMHHKNFTKTPEIYMEVGEQKFRELEYEIVYDYRDIKNTILATGGGAVINPKARPILKDIGVNIFLFLDKATFINRILMEKNINYLNGRDLFDIYNSRQEIYTNLADITIDVSKLSVAEICQTIRQKIK